MSIYQIFLSVAVLFNLFSAFNFAQMPGPRPLSVLAGIMAVFFFLLMFAP